MKVNMEELMAQRKKEILESGKYARCEVIVGVDHDAPYVQLEGKHVGEEELFNLLRGIKAIKDGIFEQYPSLKLLGESTETDYITYDALKNEMIDIKDEEV